MIAYEIARARHVEIYLEGKKFLGPSMVLGLAIFLKNLTKKPIQIPVHFSMRLTDRSSEATSSLPTPPLLLQVSFGSWNLPE